MTGGRPTRRSPFQKFRRALGLIILATAHFFVPVQILHPLWMAAFLVLTAATFCLFGFVIGIWAKGFEQLSFIPMLVVTPLTFLGGAFYSITFTTDAASTLGGFKGRRFDATIDTGIRCITTPCPSTEQVTKSSSCSACAGDLFS